MANIEEHDAAWILQEYGHRPDADLLMDLRGAGLPMPNDQRLRLIEFVTNPKSLPAGLSDVERVAYKVWVTRKVDFGDLPDAVLRLFEP